jgi:hypothetical protein
MLEVASLIASEGDPKGLLVTAWLPFCVVIEMKERCDGTAGGLMLAVQEGTPSTVRPIIVMSSSAGARRAPQNISSAFTSYGIRVRDKIGAECNCGRTR